MAAFLDEFSKAIARLLAIVDLKLRSFMRIIGTLKVGIAGNDGPFGTLSIFFAGDLLQLPLPDGGFVPDARMQRCRQYGPGPIVTHGQALLRGGLAAGMQVVY